MGQEQLASILPPDQQREINMEMLKARWTRFETRSDHILKLSEVGLRSLILLNGGAIIASFTVLGHLQELGARAEGLVPAFAWFVTGLVAAMLAILFGYLSQNAYAEQESIAANQLYEQISTGKTISVLPVRTKLMGHGFYIAIVCAVASLTFFSLGSYRALGAASAPAAGHLAPVKEAQAPRI